MLRLNGERDDAGGLGPGEVWLAYGGSYTCTANELMGAEAVGTAHLVLWDNRDSGTMTAETYLDHVIQQIFWPFQPHESLLSESMRWSSCTQGTFYPKSPRYLSFSFLPLLQTSLHLRMLGIVYKIA